MINTDIRTEGKITAATNITPACTAKLLGTPISAVSPPVNVAAVITNEIVSALLSRLKDQIDQTPQKPCGLTPVMAEIIPDKLNPLFSDMKMVSHNQRGQRISCPRTDPQ